MILPTINILIIINFSYVKTFRIPPPWAALTARPVLAAGAGAFSVRTLGAEEFAHYSHSDTYPAYVFTHIFYKRGISLSS